MFSRHKSMLVGLVCVISLWLTSAVMADVVYGPELVVNGGFDGGLTGWTTVYGSTYISNDGNLANGCVELVDGQRLHANNISVIPGAKYLLSFYMKKMGTDSDIYPGYRWSTKTDWIGNAIGFIAFTTSSWAKYSKEITAPLNAANIQIQCSNGGANRITRFDDVSLRQQMEPPVVEDLTDVTAVAGEKITVTASATDPEGGVLSYKWSSPTIGVKTGQTIEVEILVGMDEDITLTVTSDKYNLSTVKKMHIRDIYSAVSDVVDERLDTLIGDLPPGLTKIDRDGSTKTVK